MGTVNAHSMDAIDSFVRIQEDYHKLLENPIPNIAVRKLLGAPFMVDFCIRGPNGTPYQGGYYHGQIMFPHLYPFASPHVKILTPNGRFHINRIFSAERDFYDKEDVEVDLEQRIDNGCAKCVPCWTLKDTLQCILDTLTGMREINHALDATNEVRMTLARKSGRFNLKNQRFCECFPEIVKDIEKGLGVFSHLRINVLDNMGKTMSRLSTMIRKDPNRQLTPMVPIVPRFSAPSTKTTKKSKLFPFLKRI